MSWDLNILNTLQECLKNRLDKRQWNIVPKIDLPNLKEDQVT